MRAYGSLLCQQTADNAVSLLANKNSFVAHIQLLLYLVHDPCKQILLVVYMGHVISKQTADHKIVFLGIDHPGESGLVELVDAGRVLCLKCNRKFCNFRVGKRHFATAHQVNEPAMCKICSKTYKNRISRNEHMKRVHGITETMITKGFINL